MLETPNRFIPSTSGIQDKILPESGPTKTKRARKEIISPRLSAVFDKCKISDRDCVHILTAVLDAISVDPNEYIINRTSIKSAREKFRQHIFKKMKYRFDNLNFKSYVLHWYSKLLPDITGHLKVDRLPVIVTALNVEQLLGVPKLDSGTGYETSSAIYDTLEKWYLLNKVQAFVFDTTASNTDRLNGACYLLEQKLDRNILYLACRHHVYEIVLQGVFTKVKLATSTGPDILLFKKFRKEWNTIDTN